MFRIFEASQSAATVVVAKDLQYDFALKFLNAAFFDERALVRLLSMCAAGCR